LKIDAKQSKGVPHAAVIFKDEPEVIYYYHDNKGIITQSGVEPLNLDLKHRDISRILDN
jgi:hypothetical protein